MKVKICGIKTEEDVYAVIRAGADAAGLLVGQVHASTDFILHSTAARLAELLTPYTTPVLVTHLADADAIIDIVNKTDVTTLQLHGGSSLEDVKKISSYLPKTGKVIYAVHVIKKTVVPALEEFYPYIDAVLLDSYNAATGQVGGTGQVHDWELSAEIVRNSPLPVILAGGLNPENVAEAVRIVKPYGVDANSGLKNPDGSRNAKLCLDFAINARRTWMEMVQS